MTTLRQLEYFVLVADTGSFTGAAAQLRVTQPGLSQQLRALETSLGGALLERGPRLARLTPLGRAVLPHARAAVLEGSRVRETAARVLGLAAGVLDVGTINSISLGVLPDLLRGWQTLHPDAGVRVIEATDAVHVLEQLDAGSIDVALTPVPDGYSQPTRLVGVETLIVALSAGHPLARAGRTQVEFSELAEEPWVHFARDHGLAGVLDHVAQLHGFTPRAVMRTGQTAAAHRYAAAGIGLCLVPANILPPRYHGHVLQLDPPIERRVYVVDRGTSDALVTRFIDFVVNHAQLTPCHVKAMLNKQAQTANTDQTRAGGNTEVFGVQPDVTQP